MNNLVFNNNPNTLRTLLYGENNGSPIALISDNDGILYVKSINSNDELQSLPLTAFKELRVAMLTPVAGWTFNYNINPSLVKQSTNGTGTVTQSNSKAVLQTNSTANSSATIESNEVLRYIPGMGVLVRFTAIFTSGVSGSTQIIGIGDANDGFFFGYNGSSFGILRRRQGSADTWIPQQSWNKDTVDGNGLSGFNLDPTKGNIYSIRYQWLGFGAIEFNVENPATGEAILVNRITYANSSTDPSIYNPTLPIFAKVQNTTNTSNITLQTPCAMGFIEGHPTFATDLRYSVSGSKTALSSESALVTIRNKATFASKTNRVRAKIDFLSASVEGSKTAQFRLIKNATLTGASYNDISASSSVVEYDTIGTYTTNSGTVLLSFQCAKTDSMQLFLDSLNIILAPSDTITITAYSSATTDSGASISWKEMF
ncbi:MAG TPA: hypothetical protein VHQ24_01675 [Lachnospiraceae bacterium]|nr:hypothetical protein [Lachnospiraceae bacterium]